MKKLITICLVLVFVFVTYSQAIMIPFDVFTENGSYYNNSGFNVYAYVSGAPGEALFEFHNDSSFACSVEGIYFDDGSLLGISNITNFSGAKFSQFATPNNLPSGQNLSPVFKTIKGFSADSDPPVSKWGINPGEKLQIAFSLQSGKTFADVTNELANGDLRVGIHIIAFLDGSSESAVNVPEPTNIPEPATICLLGFSALSLLRKKK